MSQLVDPFQPLQVRRSSERVADAIRSSILDGVFRPGDKLPPERTLAAKFAVTRNTVREGMRRLEQLRLVSIRQGSGVTVQDYLSHAGIEFLSALVGSEETKPRIIEHMFEARAVLGEAILVHSIEHADLDRLGGFEDAVEALAREVETPSGQPRALLDLDFDVHTSLVRAGGNQAFVLFMNSMRSIYEPVAQLFAAVVDDPRLLVAKYRDALIALQGGDRDHAKTIFREVFRAGKPDRIQQRKGKRRK